MPPKLELVDQRFGRLLVRSEAGRDHTGASLWLCACDCGEVSTIRGTHLNRGLTRSCGCLARDVASHPRTHGQTHSALYSRWRSMLGRVDGDDPNYGGRGIGVCDRWRIYRLRRGWPLDRALLELANQ